MVNPSTLLSIALGAASLTLGRRLFWIFVGAVGFAAGVHYTPFIFETSSEVLRFIVALGLGLLCALLAVFFQKVAVALVGLVAGGHIGVHLAEFFGVQSDVLTWLAFGVAAVVGALVMLVVFDWALIVISSLVGASMIVGALHLEPPVDVWTFAALAVAGTIFQGAFFHRSKAQRATRGAPPAASA